jgi:hypothetical protein
LPLFFLLLNSNQLAPCGIGMVPMLQL